MPHSRVANARRLQQLWTSAIRWVRVQARCVKFAEARLVIGRCFLPAVEMREGIAEITPSALVVNAAGPPMYYSPHNAR